MRYLSILLTALITLPLLADTPTWVAPITPEIVTNKVTETVETVVTNTATSVRISNISVRIPEGQPASILVFWEWLDESNKPIRTGRNLYTEEQLDTLLDGSGITLTALRQIFMGLAVLEANTPAVPQPHHK